MIHISKVIIENFQSHKYTEINLDNNLNVIVGPSDQGKSAIIRAMKWVLYNEPSGTYFIREGEKEATVTLFFSNDCKIKRLRSTSKNQYTFYDSNGKEYIYEGFGTNVPFEIVEKLNIRKVYLDGKQSSSINIGEQLEGPFLLTEKNATRANAIGRLVGVHIVDRAVADTLKDIRGLNYSKKSLDSSLEDLELQLKNYDFLEKLNYDIKSLEKVRSIIKEKEEKLLTLRKLKDRINSNTIEIVSCNNTLNKLSHISSLSKNILLLDINIQRYKILKLKKIQLDNNSTNILEDLNILDKLVTIDSLDNTLNSLQLKLNNLINLSILNRKVIDCEKDISICISNISNLHRVNEVEKIYTNLLSMLVDLGKLTRFSYKYEDIKRRIGFGLKYLENFEFIEKLSLIPNEITNKFSYFSKLDNIKQKFNLINKEMLVEGKELDKCKKDLDRLVLLYSNILNEINVCPLCLSKIDAISIERIVTNYK